ncbi:MAG: hypothetical protein EBQ96_07530 [Proteobacteria bacterium]|nr:hypothetical protein [Pseudomonadota bacterium]
MNNQISKADIIKKITNSKNSADFTVLRAFERSDGSFSQSELAKIQTHLKASKNSTVIILYN